MSYSRLLSHFGVYSIRREYNGLYYIFNSQVDEYDSDDEELIALSSRWKLQRKNRKWSRRKISEDSLKLTISENQPLVENDGITKENDNTNHLKVNNNALELLYSRLNERRPSLYDNLPTLTSSSRNSFTKPSQIEEATSDNEVHSPVAKRRPGSDYSTPQSGNGDGLGSSPEDVTSDEEDVSRDLELVKSLNDQAPPTTKPRAKKARWHSFQKVRNTVRDSTLP